jgi:hypothetical protein
MGDRQSGASRRAEVTGSAMTPQFFALWKAADPEIPILIEAKKEYAKLD